MKEMYCVVYNIDGNMYIKDFTDYSKAKKFALKRLYTNDYPAVKISKISNLEHGEVVEMSVETITRAS